MSPFFSNRDIGHAVEGVLRLVAAGDALLAQRHKKLALRAELECLHIAPIGDPDIARTVDAEKMRGLEHVLAPATEEFAVAIDDHDRHGLIAVEYANVVFAVDIYTGSRAPFGNARRKLRPILDHAVPPVCCLSCHAM
jgi:hypothetical protein